MVCQFCWEKRLLLAEGRWQRRRETTRPATTAATRPEPSQARRGIEAMKGIEGEEQSPAEASDEGALHADLADDPATAAATLRSARATLPMSMPGEGVTKNEIQHSAA